MKVNTTGYVSLKSLRDNIERLNHETQSQYWRLPGRSLHAAPLIGFENVRPYKSAVEPASFRGERVGTPFPLLMCLRTHFEPFSRQNSTELQDFVFTISYFFPREEVIPQDSRSGRGATTVPHLTHGQSPPPLVLGPFPRSLPACLLFHI